MLKAKQLKRLREARITESYQPARSRNGFDEQGYRQGSLRFLREFCEDVLGTAVDESGLPTIPKDERGLPKWTHANRARPEEVSLRHLAEAIHGHDFVEDYYKPNGGNGFDFGSRHLMEAAIDPSAFVDVSLFNLSVFGLVNAKIIDRFNAPDYIGKDLVEIVPVNSNGYKRIGAAKISPVGKGTKGRQPGEPHVELQFGEMYQQAPVTLEQGAKILLTKEAVYFDYTGQVTQTAGEIADELAYGQDRDIAGTVLGVTGLASTYNFNGTSYEVYQTSTPYVNQQTNPLVPGAWDITNVDLARQLFVGMTDPVTGREIKVIGKTLLVAPGRELLARSQLYTADVQIGTQNTAAGFPAWFQKSGNDLAQLGKAMGQTGPYTVLPMSSIWYNIMLAAAGASYPGLGLSTTNAQKTWYVGDFPRAATWTENWPLTSWTADSGDFVLKDRGIVGVYGANYRGSTWMREPRYIVKNTQ